jgi:dTDP-4-dehydrorhamnose reductase
MNAKKVLITGANGQLGVDLVTCFENRRYAVTGYGRQGLDITDAEQVKEMFHAVRPDIVIHSAAHTKVDLAESEPDEAFRVNAYGTRNVAAAAEQIGAKLVYVSTDYVFNGQGSEPYDEFFPTDPLGVYGKSKLAGEQFVRELHSKFFIVRTSWVYGKHGHNFVQTMLKLAGEKDSISVVADQIGSPSYTVDIADCIGDLVATSQYGTYHVSNSGSCSWYEFAKAIFEEAGIDMVVQSITTDQFPRPAKRPAYSVMDHMALRVNGFPEMRHWRAALSEFLQGLR